MIPPMIPPRMRHFELTEDGNIMAQDADGIFWIGVVFRREPPTIIWRRFKEDLWVGPKKKEKEE